MLLCIDIGNTNTVFGIYKNNNLIASFRVESNLSQTYDEYGVKLLEMLNYNGVDCHLINGVIISSVVPKLDSIYENTIKAYLDIKPLFVGVGIKTGIQVKTDNPKQLGSDILVGAVAVVNKYGAPAIIIDMGTAITLFYLDQEKTLVGGVIIPGIKTAYNGLFKNAARLEEVGMEAPVSVIGKDTVSCIQSGMVYGTTEMVDGLIRRIKKEINNQDINVILTGGESSIIASHLSEKVIVDKDLILEGLKIIYQKNIR